jgi:hypothetical protein
VQAGAALISSLHQVNHPPLKLFNRQPSTGDIYV